MSGACELDEVVGDRVRLRGWAQRQHTPLGPAGAHSVVEVAWLLEGHARYRIGSRRFELGPRDVIVVPSGVEHETSLEVGARAGSLWVDLGLVDGVAAAMGRWRPSDPCVVSAFEPIVHLDPLLRLEAGQPGPGRLSAVEALTEALVVSLLRRMRGDARTAPADSRIASAIERIVHEHASDLSVDDLATTAGLSRFHFSRHFREQMGVSPYRFLTDYRLDRAAELLARGRPVTAAALEVGFRDLGRFSMKFRSRFGCPPKAYAGPEHALRSVPHEVR